MKNNILLEYSRENVKQQYKNFLSSKKEEILSKFKSIDDFLETLEEIDPKNGSEFVTIILNLYKRRILNLDYFTIAKDTLATLLKKYYQLSKKQSIKNLLPSLQDIKTSEDLDRFITKITELYNEYVENESESKKQQKGHGKIVYEGTGTKIYESYDIEHACYIGQGTLWCTATTITINHFNYYKEFFRIFTLVPKPEYKTNPREKYQTNLYDFQTLIGGIDPFYSKFIPYNVYTYDNKGISLEELKEKNSVVYKDFIDFIFKDYFPEQVDIVIEGTNLINLKHYIGDQEKVDHLFYNRAKKIYNIHSKTIPLFVNLDAFPDTPSDLSNSVKSVFNYFKRHNLRTIDDLYKSVLNDPIPYDVMFELYLYLWMVVEYNPEITKKEKKMMFSKFLSKNKKEIEEGLIEKPLYKKLMKLRKKMVKKVQEIYDDWQGENDPEFGYGGICDQISNAIADVIVSNLEDVNITEGGQEGDDHSYIIAYNDEEAYEVDIPPSIYEKGCGYRWEKIPDVKFEEDDIIIYPIDRKWVIEEVIRKLPSGKWRLYSKDRKKILGTFDTKEAALNRERQIQFFKHMKGG